MPSSLQAQSWTWGSSLFRWCPWRGWRCEAPWRGCPPAADCVSGWRSPGRGARSRCRCCWAAGWPCGARRRPATRPALWCGCLRQTESQGWRNPWDIPAEWRSWKKKFPWNLLINLLLTLYGPNSFFHRFSGHNRNFFLTIPS